MSNWACVKGLEGRYAVSDSGEVMSMDYKRSGLPGILKPQNSVGYHKVIIGGKKRMVHALVAEAFIGPRQHGLQINHKNGIKTDNRVENLEYCTCSENILHAHAAGLKTGPRGERQGNSKLTNEKVFEIRKMLRLGFMNKEIAETFGVSRVAISNIKTGSRWSHLKDEENVS